jgi:Zn-dependent protease with chaperone function/Tfp pilus assembly protein PilF
MKISFTRLGSSCFVLVLLSLLFTSCAGQDLVSTGTPLQSTRDLHLEATIEASLAKINPEAVQVYRDATTALDAGDYETSKRLYEQVIIMAPDFSTAYRRLGYIENENNNTNKSIEMLRKAVALEPNGYNQSALAMSLLTRNTSADIAEAFDLASAAAEALPDDEQAITAWLMAAFYMQNIDTLRQADARLLQIAPNSRIAHYFSGLIAADDGRWEKSERELLLSQQLGMPSEAIQDVLGTGIARNAMIFRSIRWGAFATAAWLVGLGFIIGNILSKATLKAIGTQQTFIEMQVKPQELRIRSIYRVVIGILSLYFYVSIPFVILLIFLLVGGAFYFFLSVGTIPIQIAVILLIILFGSLIAILRAVFSRQKYTPAGRELSRMDAPELWTMVENVARKLSIQPVDTIIATPFAEIAVNERGSIIKKMRGAGKRTLLIGIGAISALTQGQLAAILAHEYGHFSNRDTAGGNLAHQVYASLIQMAQRLAKSGAARIFNPAWLFVLGYERIFLRVTQGASRLQEILADRYAAMAYGSSNLIEGLQNLIRQAIVFPIQAESEIKSAIEYHRTVVNIYDLQMTAELERDCDEKYNETMLRNTSKYDSHPAPKDRINLIEKLHIPYSPVYDNPASALQMFPNPTALQQEMTALVTSNIH